MNILGPNDCIFSGLDNILFLSTPILKGPYTEKLFLYIYPFTTDQHVNSKLSILTKKGRNSSKNVQILALVGPQTWVTRNRIGTQRGSLGTKLRPQSGSLRTELVPQTGSLGTN